MKPVVSYRRLVLAMVLCALAASLPEAGRAYGAQETFRFGEGATAKQAVVEPATRNGVTYVPLGGLVRQLGGQTQVTPQRVTVDYGGYVALIQVGDTVVSGSLQQFALTHPVIEGGGEAWIAVDDVATLFRQAFAASAARADLPVAPKVDQTLPKEEDLLEKVTETPAEPATVPEPSAGAPVEKVTETPAEPATVPEPSAGAPVETTPRVVIIDAGHGGADMGAHGQTLQEKTLTLDLAQRVAKALESGPGGIKTVLTRKDDTALPMLNRINSAIQQGGLFVSLHAGAALAPTVGGVEVFYSNDDAVGEADSGGVASEMKAAERYRYAQASRDFAEAVSAALGGQEGIVLAGRHAVRSPLLHHVPMPGILIEAGFLTNAADEAALASPDHLDRLANAVAAGIQRYLGVAATAPPEAPKP